MDDEIGWDDLQALKLLEELQAMARSLLAREHGCQSLRTGELILTALRRQRRSDQDWREVTWSNRHHFFADMHRAMTQALIDHARRRRTRQRRWGRPVPLEGLSPEEQVRFADFQPHELKRALSEDPQAIDALIAAVSALESKQPELAKVVYCRIYDGLTVSETARMLGVSEPTVKRRWQLARTLLHDDVRRRLDQ